MTIIEFNQLTDIEKMNVVIKEISALNLISIRDERYTILVDYVFGFYVECVADHVEPDLKVNTYLDSSIVNKYLHYINIEDLFLPFY